MALACLAADVAVGLGARLGVAHVDHGLRPDSGQDARFVEELAGKLGLPFFIRRLGLRQASEAEAREARMAALIEMADEFGASHVLLAHTADDQAETLLMRMIRGSGTRGLAGIAPVRGRLLRPLLQVRRQALREYLAQRSQSWREDPTNHDERFFRNRVRHRLLAVLHEENPRVVETLCRVASSVQADSYALDAALEALVVPSLRRVRAEGLAAARIPEETFARFGRGGLWWALRRVHTECAVGEGQLATRHLEELLGGRAADLPGGLRVEAVTGGWAVLPRQWSQVPETGPWRIDREGEFRLSGSGWVVSARGPALREQEVWLARWQSGDRLAGRSRKVQDLFVNRKVHRWLRRRLPLGRLGGPDAPVVWVPGLWLGGWSWNLGGRGELLLRAGSGSVEEALLEVLWPDGS